MSRQPQTPVAPTRVRLVGGALRRVALAALGPLAIVSALAGCGGSSEPKLSPEARLGRLIFSDASLSASSLQSCASCHDAARGHSAPNALAVQPGGTHLELSGLRSSPSIRYLLSNGPLRFDVDGAPSGGFFWDGRAASLEEQAAGPFTNPLEMANPDRNSVVARLSRAVYAEEFKAVFGADVLADTERAFAALTRAIASFEREDATFNAFTSKYDAYLRGQVALSAQEAHGLRLFEAPTKGNCAACHPSAKGADGSFPLFTDFSYDALGVPRNPDIPANADAKYFDLGLCALDRFKDRADLCGLFKVPTLRNVALRGSLFHNGRFKSLEEALHFYAERDTNPERFYPVGADGSVRKFDDLPERYHANVNTSEAPYGRARGAAPALNSAEIDDLAAFLRTLTDGFAPP